MNSDTSNLPNNIEQFKKILSEKDKVIEKLRFEIDVLKRSVFGKRSEKYVDPNQMELFNEVEEIEVKKEAEDTETISYERKKSRGKRKPLSKDLPRREVIHDLAEDKKFCQNTGKPLHHIGEVASERLEIIPKQVYVSRHVELKYACRCCDESNVVKAAKPLQVIPKGIASHSLLAYIGVSKYLDSLPIFPISLHSKLPKCQISCFLQLFDLILNQ